MEHADYFHALLFEWAIEDEILMETRNGPQPHSFQTWIGKFASWAELRHRRKLFKRPERGGSDSVRCVDIVTRDDLPDVPEILPSR